MATARQRAIIPGEGEIFPLSMARDHPNGGGRHINGVDYPLTLAPRKKVMTLIRMCGKTCLEFAFGISFTP